MRAIALPTRQTCRQYHICCQKLHYHAWNVREITLLDEPSAEQVGELCMEIHAMSLSPTRAYGQVCGFTPLPAHCGNGACGGCSIWFGIPTITSSTLPPCLDVLVGKSAVVSWMTMASPCSMLSRPCGRCTTTLQLLCLNSKVSNLDGCNCFLHVTHLFPGCSKPLNNRHGTLL